MKNLYGILFCMFLLVFGACKNDSNNSKTDENSDELKVGRKTTAVVTSYECTLQNGYLMGVKLGMEVDSLQKRFPKGFIQDKVTRGKETIPVYLCVAANGEHITLFPEMKEGKKVVKKIEYEGNLCRTDKGIGISSSFKDLQAAYDQLRVRSVDSAGRVTMQQGLRGWCFVLGTEGLTFPVDVSKISPDVRVTTISIQ
ncbi:MAG: hypothetical protein KGS48_03040 [Bacteroidetes bacterium]|nr:hypothetical protein [Bacteroidota bacterium]